MYLNAEGTKRRLQSRGYKIEKDYHILLHWLIDEKNVDSSTYGGPCKKGYLLLQDFKGWKGSLSFAGGRGMKVRLFTRGKVVINVE